MGQKETKPEPKQSASDKMFDVLFEFKQQAKIMKKEASRAEAEYSKYEEKVKQAIDNNNLETAKIFASDAIRKKTEAKRLLILSSKLEAVQARLKSAMTTQKLTENMQEMTMKLGSALNIMDMNQVNESMKTFENMFDNLDIKNNLMNEVFDNVNAGVINEKEVATLISQVAEQHHMNLEGEFADISVKNKLPVKKSEVKEAVNNSQSLK